jgi:methyl-accepting chemotaxis protein
VIAQNQGHVVISTVHSFNDLRDKFTSLHENVSNVNSMTKELLYTNEQIVQCVDSLSACSEEVAASVNEVVAVSQRNVDDVKHVSSELTVLENMVLDLAKKD